MSFIKQSDIGRSDYLTTNRLVVNLRIETVLTSLKNVFKIE